MSKPDTRPATRSRWLKALSANELTQRLHEKSMAASFALGAAVLVFLVAIVATETILHFRAAEATSQKASAALAFASELRARTDRELNSALYLGSGIVGYLSARNAPTERNELKRVLAAVHHDGPHIRNLTLAIGYTIAEVHPLAGNEPVIGRDYRDLPAQWPSVRRAIGSRSVVLTGPVKLVQGGTGLIYRRPIFINDQYWGLLSTVIDIPSLLAAAIKGLDKERFEFAIRTEEQGGAGDGMLWGNLALLANADTVQLEAPMPNGRWIYGVRVTGTDEHALTWAIRGLGWVMAILAGWSVVTVLRQRRELSRQAGFDPLTSLPNRRLFDDRLEQSLRRRQRNGIGQVAIIFIDLNDFKSINDLHGHRAGDLVLQVVATRIREEIRLGDTVSRWAGDEYVLIVEDTNAELLAILIERLRQQIETPINVDDLNLAISAAFGAACYPNEATTSVAMLDLADKRMYQNKTKAKGHGEKR